MCHTIIFSTASVILSQLITSSSLKHQSLSYSSTSVKYFIIFIFLSFIQLLYLYGINGLGGFTLSVFGTSRHRCCRFIISSSPIPIQLFDCSQYVTFAILFFTYYFNLMTSFPISMLHTVGILLELHAIRSCPLSLVG